MDYDRQEPASKAIVFWSAVSVLLLFALVPVLRSYFESQVGERYDASLEGTDSELVEHKDAVDEKLRTVDATLKAVASKGLVDGATGVFRHETGRDGLGAVEGWANNKAPAKLRAAQRAVTAAEQRRANAARAKAIAAAARAAEEGVAAP